MIGEQYIKNFKIIRDNYAIYETKKMYFDNKMRLSNIALISIILLPIIYVIAAIIIFSFLNLNSSLMAGIFWIGIIAFSFLGILIACIDYQRKIYIHLFLDQKNDKIALTIDSKEFVFYQPKHIHIAIHEYPLYSSNHRYKPIILIVFDLVNQHQNLDLNDFEKLRIASVQCDSVIEAKKIYDKVVGNFNPLLQWLNLSIIHEKEIIKHERFFYLK